MSYIYKDHEKRTMCLFSIIQMIRKHKALLYYRRDLRL